MPASGPVYQPTTITYNQESDWAPMRFLTQNVFRPRVVHWAVLILGLMTLAAGIVLIVEGSVDLYDTKGGETPDSEDKSANGCIPIVGGVLIVLFCIVFFGVYACAVWKRNECPCFPSKEQRLARQLDNQVENGQVRNSSYY